MIVHICHALSWSPVSKPAEVGERQLIKVAACQLLPALEIESRKDQMVALIKRAEIEEVDFICFPEGFLTGYYSEEEPASKSALDINKEAFADWVNLTSGYSVTVDSGLQRTC